MGEGEILKSINIGGRVNQLVFQTHKHLGRLDPRGGLHCFWCLNKAWTPLIGAFCAQKIIKNGIELKKLCHPQIRGGPRTQKKTIKRYKTSSQSPHKFLIGCFVAIKVQKWFVKLQLVLL